MTKLGDREIPSQPTRFANRAARADDDDKVVSGVLFRRPNPTSEQINCEVYLEGEREPVLAFFYARMTMTFGDELVGQTFGAIRRQFRERDIAQAFAARAVKSYSFTFVTTQAEGRTAEGRPYYFSARRGRWWVYLGSPRWPTSFSDWPSRSSGALAASGVDDTNGRMTEAQVRAILDHVFAEPNHA